MYLGDDATTGGCLARPGELPRNHRNATNDPVVLKSVPSHVNRRISLIRNVRRGQRTRPAPADHFSVIRKCSIGPQLISTTASIACDSHLWCHGF